MAVCLYAGLQKGFNLPNTRRTHSNPSQLVSTKIWYIIWYKCYNYQILLWKNRFVCPNLLFNISELPKIGPKYATFDVISWTFLLSWNLPLYHWYCVTYLLQPCLYVCTCVSRFSVCWACLFVICSVWVCVWLFYECECVCMNVGLCLCVRGCMFVWMWVCICMNMVVCVCINVGVFFMNVCVCF